MELISISNTVDYHGIRKRKAKGEATNCHETNEQSELTQKRKTRGYYTNRVIERCRSKNFPKHLEQSSPAFCFN